MGFLDNLFKGDPEERARREAEKEEQLRYQKEMLERRSDPRKMSEYEEKVDERRKAYAKERAVYNFQQKDQGDPLDDFLKKKKAGIIKVSAEARDESSSRLGSAGLQSVRTDERMPYIDRGYVPGEKFTNVENTVSVFEDEEKPRVRIGKKRSTTGSSKPAFTTQVAEDDSIEVEKQNKKPDVIGDFFKGMFGGK